MFPRDFRLNDLRSLVLSGQTREEEWRRIQLSRIQRLLDNHEEEIINALNKDLEKPPTEAFFELIALRQELKLAKENLKKWIQPKRIKIPLALNPGSASIQHEPLGCVLIIGPWNYPFSLTLQPLISALAAGNTAVLKPSENSPNTSNLISSLISEYFPKNIVRVIEGDGSIAEQLINLSFDHIFFTGGSQIGKEVMKAASQHLTPLTLELGGKSPAIILPGADLAITAKRIIWGKGLNAGQTCVAPDHLLVDENLKLPLLDSMKNTIKSFYGEQPLKSKHLAKIINDYHFKRLKRLLEQAADKKQIIFGGEMNAEQNRISPTIIEIEDRNDPLMEEEIFGPLIPILKFKNLDKTLNEIRYQPKPLALYVFGGTANQQQEIIDRTSSGGICINDVVMQAGIPELPFGGVGASGMGQYHGYSGFKTFSHQKSILKKPFWLDIKFRYPPYKLDISFLRNLLS